MRAEFKTAEKDLHGYSMARGLFFDDDEAYVVEVYGGGRSDEFGIKLFDTDGEEREFDIVYNQPKLDGVGVGQSLSMTSEEASLPTDDESIEAFARYALQEEVEEDLRYSGPRGLEDLEY